MGSEIKVTLRQPVQFGRDAEPVTELVLKPTGRALRDLEVTMGVESDKPTIQFKPFPFALVGLKMAGVAGGAAFLDLMDARDVWEVGQTVMGFIMGAQNTGPTP